MILAWLRAESPVSAARLTDAIQSASRTIVTTAAAQ
jgi:hypothetical protein